jgi:hypothetical protein
MHERLLMAITARTAVALADRQQKVWNLEKTISLETVLCNTVFHANNLKKQFDRSSGPKAKVDIELRDHVRQAVN